MPFKTNIVFERERRVSVPEHIEMKGRIFVNEWENLRGRMIRDR